MTGLGFVWVRFKGNHPKIGMIWNIIRGHPVAYRIRIENGGLVFGSEPAMVVGCTIIGPGYANQVEP